MSANQYGGADVEGAYKKGEALLSRFKNPNGSLGVDGIFCPNESTTMAMLRVLQDNGGAGKVTFEPEQFKVYTDYRSNSPWTPGWAPPPVPPDGKYPVTMTFGAPGTYVVRVMAHDGGLMNTQDVTVRVSSN